MISIESSTNTAHSKVFNPQFSPSFYVFQMSNTKRPLDPSPDELPVSKRVSPLVDTQQPSAQPDLETPIKLDSSDFDHPPVTSHGTYLRGIRDRVEDLEDYREGGYHPVHLGDFLGANDRYHVLHKLGHGGYGTVWLCRDTEKSAYVAVKIHVASVAADDMMEKRLAALDQNAQASAYLALPIDNFTIQGPNGTHECLVSALLGPPVSPDLWLNMEHDPNPILRKFGHQAVLALDFLHKNGICHGDFRPGNILVRLTNLDHLDEKEIVSLLGEPMLCHVHTESGRELPVSSPRYLVSAARTADLPAEYLSDDICVIDFGESYLIASPPEDLGIPVTYLPPEMLLELDELQVEYLNSLDKDPAPTDSETSENQKPFPVGIACDLWALGCTLFEIQKQQALFYMMSDPGEILESTMIFFGPFPESWMEGWASRPQHMPKDSDGDSDVTRYTFDKALAYVLDFNGLKQLSLTEQEQKVFRDLLLKLFQYEPEKRAHTEEVLAHEWFRL